MHAGPEADLSLQIFFSTSQCIAANEKMPNNNRVSRWINNRFSREQEEEGSSTQDEGGDQGSGAHQGPARSSDGDAPSVEVRGSNEIEEEGAASEIKDHNRSPSKVSPSKNVTGEVDKKERLDAADRSNGSEVPSHPVTPSPDKTRRSVSTPVVSNGKANGESNDIQSHLRKVTANLVDMLDTMSNSTQTTPAGSSQGTRDFHLLPTLPIIFPFINACYDQILMVLCESLIAIQRLVCI